MVSLLPFERAILRGIESGLPVGLRAKYAEQRALINKVQRLLDWNEIEFYCTRWFKVRWPSEALFENRSEFELGSGTLQASGAVADVKVWSVGGHLFSIESKTPLKPFRAKADALFVMRSPAQPFAAADGFAAR